MFKIFLIYDIIILARNGKEYMTEIISINNFEKYYKTSIDTIPIDFIDNIFLVKNEFHINAVFELDFEITINCKFNITTFEKKMEYASDEVRVVTDLFNIIHIFFRLLRNRGEDFLLNNVIIKHYFLDRENKKSLLFEFFVNYASGGSTKEKKFFFEDVQNNETLIEKLNLTLQKLY